MESYRGILNIVMSAILWALLTFITFGVALLGLAAWSAVVFSGADKRREAALVKLRHTLMPNERLIAEAVQLRPFALWSRRRSVGMTESRIIVVARGLIGGFTMRDIQWKDLQDAELGENVLPEICGSSLSFAFRKGDLGSRANVQRGTSVNASGLTTIVIGGVPSEEARMIYANAQSQEQAWEEKRRVRTIEETRAAAGGVYLNTNHGDSKGGEAGGTKNLVEELGGLKKLLDGGAITDVEFNEMKSKIIARA